MKTSWRTTRWRPRKGLTRRHKGRKLNQEIKIKLGLIKRRGYQCVVERGINSSVRPRESSGLVESGVVAGFVLSACYLEPHRLEKTEKPTTREFTGNANEGKTKRERGEARRENNDPPTGGCNSNGRPRAYIYMSDLIACRNDINHSRLTYPRPFASRYLPPFSPLPTPPGPSRETVPTEQSPQPPRRRVLPLHGYVLIHLSTRYACACICVSSYIRDSIFLYMNFST